MLTKIYGNMVFECDGCGETLETETEDFEAARATLRRQHWASVQHRGVWQHYCPICGKAEVNQ